MPSFIIVGYVWRILKRGGQKAPVPIREQPWNSPSWIGLNQPHFDYSCPAWYPNQNKKFKSKLQTVQNKCIRYSKITEVTLEQRTLKKLTGSRFVKYLITFKIFVLMLFNFLRKLGLYIFMILYRQSESSKYEIFCFETKTSYKKHVLWSKKIILSDTNSFEHFAKDLKLSNSLNDFKHKLKDHSFKKLRNMEQDIFAYWRRITNFTVIFSINWGLSTIHNIIVFHVNIFKQSHNRLVFIFSRLLASFLILIVPRFCLLKRPQWK